MLRIRAALICLAAAGILVAKHNSSLSDLIVLAPALEPSLSLDDFRKEYAVFLDPLVSDRPIPPTRHGIHPRNRRTMHLKSLASLLPEKSHPLFQALGSQLAPEPHPARSAEPSRASCCSSLA